MMMTIDSYLYWPSAIAKSDFVSSLIICFLDSL